jgi:hypothetical protein
MMDCYVENAENIRKLEVILFDSVLEEYKIVSEDLTAIRHDMKMKFESLSKEDEHVENEIEGPQGIMISQREELL